MTPPKSKKEEFFDKFYRTWVVGDKNADNLNELNDCWQYITDNFVPKEEVKEIVMEFYKLGMTDLIGILCRKKMAGALMAIDDRDIVKAMEGKEVKELLSKHNISD